MTPFRLLEELRKTLVYLSNFLSYVLPLNDENAFKLIEYISINIILVTTE